MTTSLRSRLTQPGAIVALGAHDGLTARIAERAGVEALYHGGYALAAHHFGVPDVGLVGRAEVVESVRRMRGGDGPADHRRRRHRLRVGGRRLAHDARARGRRRERGADRGPGLAQALRPHGGERGDPGRGDGDQGARRRRGATLGRDADHRPLGRAAGDRARGHDRPLQRLRRGGRRPRLRRRAPHRRGVRGDRRADAPRPASRTCRRPGGRRRPDRGAGGDGLQGRDLPEHPDLGLREGVRGAVPRRHSRPDDGVARGSLHELRRGQRAARPRRVAVADERAGRLRARGFGGRQGAGERPAVVVVDFIEGFTNPESALACDADAAVEATRRCSTRRGPRRCRSSSRRSPTTRAIWSARRSSSRRRRRSPRSGPARPGSRSTRASVAAPTSPCS